MSDVEHLVERSGELKQQLLAFARQPRFAKALRQEIHRRFGEVVVAEDGELENFFDWFVQQYRRPDGRTVIDCFLDTARGLSEDEQEFLLGWREVVEGIFEVTGRDGPVLLAENVIDDLTYRVHANVGPAIFEQLPVGDFVLGRVVPVGDEWLISGVMAQFGPDDREPLLRVAAQTAMETPQAVFRNPERLARAWELQREDRAAFVAHFGTDAVTLPPAELPARLRGLAAGGTPRMGGIAAMVEAHLADLPPGTETVGLIFDEWDGLGVYADHGLVEEAFADPELVRQRRHRSLLKAYLDDESVSPVPLVRLAQRDPDRADRVFRLLTGKPRFRWDRDGEALLRRHKPWAFDRPPLPRTVVLSDRLAPYAARG